jgi:hypothetical protein
MIQKEHHKRKQSIDISYWAMNNFEKPQHQDVIPWLSF